MQQIPIDCQTVKSKPMPVKEKHTAPVEEMRWKKKDIRTEKKTKKQKNWEIYKNTIWENV